MLKLKVMKSGVEVMQVDLDGNKKSVSIGREESADVFLSNRAVGRKHALVLIGPDSISVQKKSKFGKLLVNGAEVEESPLKLGDEMAIADVLLRLINEEEPAESLSAITPKSIVSIAPESPVDKSGFTADIAIVPDEKSKEIPVEESQNAQAEKNIFESPIQVAKADESSSTESSPISLEMTEKTAVLDSSKVQCKLVLKSGAANIEELVLEKEEISVGRGSECDVILTDKKASRKHIVIRKAGAQFVLVDLGSANGTLLNGEKITEQALSGNDVIKIGDTEITFKADNQQYFENQQNFISVPEEEEKNEQDIPSQNTDPGVVDEMNVNPIQTVQNGNNALLQDFGGVGQASINPGIPGITGAPKVKKETLLEKFKSQPPMRRVMILIVLGIVLFFLFGEEDKKKVTTKKSEVKSEDASFSKLPKEKQQFIINTYDLAYNYYKNEQYDKALYEVEKILQILPTGYKESRDIKIYAQKAIEIIKSREEETKRKEAEEKLKLEIAELVEKAQKLVDEGKDAEAKEVFSKILEKDPENPTILRLRQQIEEKDQKLAAEKEAEKEKLYKIRQLKDLLAEGEKLLQAEKYYEAIEKMEDAPVVFSGDEALLKHAKDIILQARSALRTKVDPFLREAKTAFDAGNFPQARDSFYKALQVDVRNSEAKEGLSKIREILHSRAKKIYTEAVIYEGVSDFQTARAKYRECLDQAMKDDVYFGRCTRKLKRFELLDRSASFSNGVESMSIPSSGIINTSEPRGPSSDPQMPKLPEPVDLSKDTKLKSTNEIPDLSSAPSPAPMPPTESVGSPVLDEAKKRAEQKVEEKPPEHEVSGFGESQ